MPARCNVWCFALFVAALQAFASAADTAAINQAIARGRAVLKLQFIDAPIGVLAAYALVKTGEPVDAPIVQAAVNRIVYQVQAGEYTSSNNPQHHIYEAAISLLLLEATGPEIHPFEIDAITQYLLARQNEAGVWYYPNHPTNIGDTSISQYGILGLWASARMGRDIPRDVWDRAGRWLLSTQRSDGGFVYHPHEGMSPTFSMTAAGTGSLMIIRLMLHGQSRPAEAPLEKVEEKRPEDAAAPPVAVSVAIPGRKRYGILEPVAPVEEPKKAAGGARSGVPRLSASELDSAIRKGISLLDQTIVEGRYAPGTWTCYSMYSIERIGALHGSAKLVDVDWYDRGAEILFAAQRGNGEWSDSNGPTSSTSFALLFLTKATGSVFKPLPRILGGGLLVGGRGLPADLINARLNGADVGSKKPRSPIDELLANLEKTVDVELPTLQTELVEAVQLDQAPGLVGQVPRLRKLAVDPRPEVRRTAVWALARSQDISAAPLLIRSLADPDVAVVREASFGLCILSRRPEGMGLAIEPLEGLPEDATEEQQSDHLRTWRAAAMKKWNDWYLKVRPYDERDDRQQIQTRK